MKGSSDIYNVVSCKHIFIDDWFSKIIFHKMLYIQYFDFIGYKLSILYSWVNMYLAQTELLLYIMWILGKPRNSNGK